MRFMTKKSERGDGYVVQLELDASDLVRAKLTPHDRMLLAVCEQSTSISDKLLALETIALRVEEAYQQEGLQ